jgi:type I site-specific restriction-modification system R (restriction) subunit
VASGGIIFTTIQKFLPPDNPGEAALSRRRNIVVIADEAHRSQYGFEARLDPKTGELTYGFAKRVRFRMRLSSASLARLLKRTIATPARCSATTSTSMTSSKP